MPTLGWNKATWQGDYNWEQHGEEWSRAWGTTEAQWFGSVYPRIHRYLPADHILEIAPGFGRWTQFLRGHSNRMTLVDLSETCIDHCRQRFADMSQTMSFFTNDGTSLAMVEDNSVDFVFSFDSLVHADADVLEAYVGQLQRKMKPDGVAFLHHSNLRPFAKLFRLQKHLRPAIIRDRIMKRRFDFWDHHRSYTMSATRFAALCDVNGLQCISQELINWGGPLPIDCLSVVTGRESRWARRNRVLTNADFMREAAHISRLSGLYSESARINLRE